MKRLHTYMIRSYIGPLILTFCLAMIVLILWSLWYIVVTRPRDRRAQPCRLADGLAAVVPTPPPAPPPVPSGPEAGKDQG